MGKKNKKEKKGGKASATARPAPLSEAEVVIAALTTALPDADQDAVQLAAEMVIEGLPELRAVVFTDADVFEESVQVPYA